MSRFLPLALVIAALATACTADELATVGKVLLDATPSPVATGAASSAPSASPAAAASVAPDFLSADEQEMYRLLLAYRAEKGLEAIPVSASLTKVARTHVADLLAHPPDGAPCNMHSWSTDGPWTSGCYTPDHANAKMMWNKPRELTPYPGNGYEIAFGTSGTATPLAAIESWKKSAGHNAVMVNLDVWQDARWQAVGMGINQRYAVIWFGKEPDSNP